MTLTPQLRAVGAMLVTAVVTASPFTLGLLLQADWVDRWRASPGNIYALWAVSFVASYGAYVWVYRKYARPAAGAAPAATELTLAADPLPPAAWLSLGPPLLVAVALGWITQQGADLSWRYTNEGPLGTGALYREMVTHALLVTAGTGWLAGVGFAAWHGMSRVYPARRALLLGMVLGQWVGLVWIVDAMFWNTFRVPVLAATISHTLHAIGICVLVAWGVQLQKLHGQERRFEFYTDARDPTCRGPRGLNLASVWFHGLAGSAMLLLLLAVCLLRWAYA